MRHWELYRPYIWMMTSTQCHNGIFTSAPVLQSDFWHRMVDIAFSAELDRIYIIWYRLMYRSNIALPFIIKTLSKWCLFINIGFVNATGRYLSDTEWTTWRCRGIPSYRYSSDVGRYIGLTLCCWYQGNIKIAQSFKFWRRIYQHDCFRYAGTQWALRALSTKSSIRVTSFEGLFNNLFRLTSNTTSMLCIIVGIINRTPVGPLTKGNDAEGELMQSNCLSGAIYNKHITMDKKCISLLISYRVNVWIG